MSAPPAGFVLVEGQPSVTFTRELLAATARAGLDPALVARSPENNGFFVPAAAAALLAGAPVVSTAEPPPVAPAPVSPLTIDTSGLRVTASLPR